MWQTISSMPTGVQIALVILAIMIVFAIFKRLMKFAFIAALLLIFVAVIYSFLRN
jgi:uncharacterized membrane protein YccC